MDGVLDLQLEIPDSIPVSVQNFDLCNTFIGYRSRRFTHRVTFSMGHTGANRKSPNGGPWEALSQTHAVDRFLYTPDTGPHRKKEDLPVS